MPRIVFGMTLVGLVLAVGPLGAAAGNVKSAATTSTSPAAPASPVVPSPPFPGFNPGGFQGFDPQPFPGFNPQGGPLRRRRDVIVVSPPVVVTGSCWAPGYWTYQWVPPVDSFEVWVPAQWAPDGSWIESHYEVQSTSGGYYQELWVSERWLC